ncbi:hypothetical protein KVV02_000012 [Mortierella alpina]|uniref:Uncharacterized protein n=1 Tax=Mortierella alpina TaxID=64518 RepID=A0A9P8A7B0_MORAP|nr:hypothetical protein KVV02_000012 [Mortierella alpina]
MTSVETPMGAQPPSHTFMDQKPPLMPRQSTNDVLSFTKIIADRLSPGQNVWDYFSPAPPPSAATTPASSSSITETAPPAAILSPPTSPTAQGFSLFGNKRQSVIVDAADVCTSPTTATSTDGATAVPATASTTSVTPKARKRKSFAQSLRSMLSLSQLLSSSKPMQPTGPPHYNILVLGSDSAPLASTLYKMSGQLPSTNKISHYQEISGFFVAHFRSNGSFTCSPKSSTELSHSDVEQKRRSVAFKLDDKDIKSLSQQDGTTAGANGSSDTATGSNCDAIQDPDASTTSTPVAAATDSPLNASANASLSVHAFSLDTTWPVPRMLAQTFWFPHAHGIIYIVDASRKNDPRGMDHLVAARQFLSSLMTDPHFKRRDIPVVVFANKAGLDDETCYRVDEIADILGCEEWEENEATKMMVQQASLDTGVVATASSGSGSGLSSTSGTPAGSPAARPWCVKSTRSDGQGEGLRESVEWLKSRMGEIWK